MRTACLTAGMLMLLCGCSEMEIWNFGKKEIPRATPEQPAVEVLCLWTPAEGRNENGIPTRGLAGQIFFFTRGDATPVAVDGEVRVYLFDNQGTVAEQSRPIHRFDFSPTAWNAHLQLVQLGPAYSIFIPYTKPIREQVQCALRLRFKPLQGPTIYSDMATVTLPGPLPETNGEPLATKPSQAKLESVTIPLTRPTGPRTAETPTTVPTESVIQPVNAEVDPQEERLRRLEEKLDRILSQAEHSGDWRPAQPTMDAHRPAMHWQESVVERPQPESFNAVAQQPPTVARRSVPRGPHPLLEDASDANSETTWHEDDRPPASSPVRQSGTAHPFSIHEVAPRQASIDFPEDPSLLTRSSEGDW